MKCASCNIQFNDGAFCNGCKRDFGCALILETGEKWVLTVERIEDVPNVKPLANYCRLGITWDYTIDLREQKVLLGRLSEVVNDVKAIKNEILDLKLACEFNSAKLD